MLAWRCRVPSFKPGRLRRGSLKSGIAAGNAGTMRRSLRSPLRQYSSAESSAEKLNRRRHWCVGLADLTQAAVYLVARRHGVAVARLARGQCYEGECVTKSAKILAASVLMAMAACSSRPATDAALASEAQHAVESKLGAQGEFSLMESVVTQNIACGHVTASSVSGRGNVDQDFVYRDRRLIMDDDPDFDSAALACDMAAGGGNSSDADNTAEN